MIGDFLTRNSIEYTLNHIFKVAGLTTDYNLNISLDKMSILVNVSCKVIKFQLSSQEDVLNLLLGKSVLQYIKTADDACDLPIMIKPGLPFAQIFEDTLTINADIITLSFIMLSRYEETLPFATDVSGNFVASQSIANKYGFIDIPIVDEYAMLLRVYLESFMSGFMIVPRKPKITTTHDIDEIRRFGGFFKSIRTILGGDLISRKSLSIAKESVMQYLRSYKDPDNDPLIIAADKLIHLSKQLGLRSEFYFMGAKKGQYNYGYNVCSPAVRSLMYRIIENDMVVGFHAGYDTYRNAELFLEEKLCVEKALGAEVSGGRQHYLRFDINTTYKIWQHAGMKYDSTVGYNTREGFRCGTCHEFHPWNFENDNAMKLIERPLIVMDATLMVYRNMDINNAFDTIMRLYARCKSVEGNFIILWHNGSVFRDWLQYYNEVYCRFLNSVC